MSNLTQQRSTSQEKSILAECNFNSSSTGNTKKYFVNLLGIK